LEQKTTTNHVMVRIYILIYYEIPDLKIFRTIINTIIKHYTQNKNRVLINNQNTINMKTKTNYFGIKALENIDMDTTVKKELALLLFVSPYVEIKDIPLIIETVQMYSHKELATYVHDMKSDIEDYHKGMLLMNLTHKFAQWLSHYQLPSVSDVNDTRVLLHLETEEIMTTFCEGLELHIIFDEIKDLEIYHDFYKHYSKILCPKQISAIRIISIRAMTFFKIKNLKHYGTKPFF